jgi:hypothetical protein
MHGSTSDTAFDPASTYPRSSAWSADGAAGTPSANDCWWDPMRIGQSTHLEGEPLCHDAAVRIRDQALEEAAQIADQVAAGRDELYHALAALAGLIADEIRSQKQGSFSNVAG